MTQADPAPITPALSAADLNTEINHEPRIMDLRLAEVLGFDRPRDIRKLIERHRDALEQYGEICSTVERLRATVARSRPSKAYWLNRPQAIHLCTQARTARASEITVHVVTVFVAHTFGQPALPPPETKLLPAPAPEQDRSLLNLFSYACGTLGLWRQYGLVTDKDRALWIALQAVFEVAGVEAPVRELAGLKRRG